MEYIVINQLLSKWIVEFIKLILQSKNRETIKSKLKPVGIYCFILLVVMYITIWTNDAVQTSYKFHYHHNIMLHNACQ